MQCLPGMYGGGTATLCVALRYSSVVGVYQYLVLIALFALGSFLVADFIMHDQNVVGGVSVFGGARG